MKVLVVEDQCRLATLLKQGLSEAGYRVDSADSCAAARDAFCKTNYDAIVLDLGLPDGDGLDLLLQWRQGGFNEPVIILSARDTAQDRVKGLDLGADDYLPKPFSLQELLARLRSVLRRHSNAKDTVLEHRGLRLDPVGRTLHFNGEPVELTTRELALLEIFMQNPGRILPRTLLCDKVWSSHYDVDTNLLDVYISKLRSRFEIEGEKPLFKTIRDVGYQLQ
jgi:DNA-binding response OmpR family regulator